MNTLYMFFAASNEPSPVSILEIHGKTETPVPASSARMAMDRRPPMIPAKIAKMMYIVPMSLWFVEKR